nr:RepB family plasmid replication initiator protein [Vibrio cholerae]
MTTDYLQQCRVHRNTAYQALKDACDDLFARQFSYQSLSEKGNTINHKSRWVSEVAYIDNEAVVRLIFAPAIVPLITRLEEQFTKYEIQQISNLTSAYAVRLYEILIAWRSTGKTPLITSLERIATILGNYAYNLISACSFENTGTEVLDFT